MTTNKTAEHLRSEIKEAEQELYKLKSELENVEIIGVDKAAYNDIQSKISYLQEEINNDTFYVKTTYNQLLEIKKHVETSIRINNDEESLKISEKVHQAFLMLIKLNEKLNEKNIVCNKLVEERTELLKKSTNKALVELYEKNVLRIEERLNKLREQLNLEENSNSTTYQNKIKSIFDEEKDLENDLNLVYPRCAKCGKIMTLKISQYGDVFWGCPNFSREDRHPSESYQGDKEKAKKLINLQGSLKKISISLEEKELLNSKTISFDEYPNILESDWNNYLFQSLSIPSELSVKECIEKFLKHSKFRVFTKLPCHDIDEKKRAVFSLSLRLLNRGVLLPSNKKSEYKLKKIFPDQKSNAFSSILTDYIIYSAPQNKYDSAREKSFAEYYFPKVLGDSWATYVYSQMPMELLIETDNRQQFKNRRVDFLVCIGNKKIVIELDGDDHNQKVQDDRTRDDELSRNGYIVKRFANADVDAKSEKILSEIRSLLSYNEESELLPINEKYLVACKVTHQISIAILKSLEEGLISSNSNLNIKISSPLFNESEQKLLLQVAVEELSDVVHHFADLYDVDINIDLSDNSAEKYWIHIGNGDNDRNSIIIRDIVLPMNYLCSIHPFPLVFPKESCITEEILGFFLNYAYGYSTFRPGQFVAIRRTLCRKESIVLLPTGSGKSVIYQLGSMLLPGITVVISPLMALIEDQINNLADIGMNNVASIFSDDEKIKEKMLKKARAIMNNHSAMMLYIAPERLQIPNFRKEIEALNRTNNFCMVAIDEAHCVSEWGHDFRAAYLQIGRSCRRLFGKSDFVPPILALTGTASDNVLRDVKRDLEISSDEAIISPPSFDRPELHFSVIPCNADKKFLNIVNLLTKILPKKFECSADDFAKLCGNDTYSGIIFTVFASKEGDYSAWSLFQKLSKNEKCKSSAIGTYFSTEPKYANFEDDKAWKTIIKSYALDFKENKSNLLIATKAFGMGIDKPNIRYVIHNGLPGSIEQYYQEVGRAGRDRNHSECVLLFSNTNDVWNENILNPNEDWESFKDDCSHSPNEEDDISPLIYFHNQNFKGAKFEKEVLFSLLYCVYNFVENHNNFNEDEIKVITCKDVEERYLIKKRKSNKDEYNIRNDDTYPSQNDIAKAVIRLVTLGIIKDYEYDYSRQEYKIICGNIEPDSVKTHYLTFVEGCSRGRLEYENLCLNNISGIDSGFTEAVVERYVDLIYETIETGRRRAIRSMFLLAKEASKKSGAEQDEYIHGEIQNYLVKDDTVDIVKSSNDEYDNGLSKIENAYPLYNDHVTIDRIEQENAKKTSGYAARVLESDPKNPGLLYLRAITSIKSGNYSDIDVVNDIVAFYQNAINEYSIVEEIAMVYLIKAMNLAFNSSRELFDLLWEKIDKANIKGKRDIINYIISKAYYVCESFKDYFQLHVAEKALEKMIGGTI